MISSFIYDNWLNKGIFIIITQNFMVYTTPDKYMTKQIL